MASKMTTKKFPFMGAEYFMKVSHGKGDIYRFALYESPEKGGRDIFLASFSRPILSKPVKEDSKVILCDCLRILKNSLSQAKKKDFSIRRRLLMADTLLGIYEEKENSL